MAELHKVDFQGFELEKQPILDMIPGQSRDFIEDTLDDLYEDWEDNGLDFCPYAQWMELSVEYIDDGHVKLGNVVCEDAYLAEKLKDVNKAYAYYTKISDGLTAYYDELDDALDTFIMNYAMIHCLHAALKVVVADLADYLPDYCKGGMEVPGVEGRWSLAGNVDIAKCFQEADNTDSQVELRDGGLNKIRFSQFGLIYGIMPEGCTGRWRAKLGIEELTEEIMESSGH